MCKIPGKKETSKNLAKGKEGKRERLIKRQQIKRGTKRENETQKPAFEPLKENKAPGGSGDSDDFKGRC